MARMVVLLRAVNVGGHNKLPMADFRESLTGLGFGGVATYIQSGNAVFDSPLGEAEAAGAVRSMLERDFALRVPVVVRTAAEMAEVAAANPFAGRDLDPAWVTATFLNGPAPAGLLVPQGCPEEAVASGREVWVYFPAGQGRSRLDRTSFWKPLAGMDYTSRNLRTIVKLRDMAAA